MDIEQIQNTIVQLKQKIIVSESEIEGMKIKAAQLEGMLIGYNQAKIEESGAVTSEDIKTE